MSETIALDSVHELNSSSQLAIYRAIYSAISDAVIFVDTDRNIVLINDAAYDLFGYTLEEVRGKRTQIFYENPEDYYDQGKKRYSRSGASKSEVYDIKYKRKNGELFIGETLGSHVHDEHGNLIGFIGVIRDITEQKKALELIGRFGRIIEDSLNEVYLFDHDTLFFIDVNRGARENLGYKITELHGMTPFDIKPDFTESEFKKMLIPLYNQTEKLLQFETRHQRKDGSIYPTEVHLQRVDLEGDFFFLAIILDITERKQAERELQKHRDHLEQLVQERSAVLKEQAQIINQIHDSVISTDLDGIITSWNNGASNLFGYDAEEILGQHISTVYPKDQHEYLTKQVIEPLKNRGENEIEVQMQKKNGKKFYAHLSLSLLYDDAGIARGMVGYSIDITARKKAEADAERHANELALANEELRRFNYSVSHDLKAPLRAIDGFSAAILQDYNDHLDDEGKDYLNRIRSAAQRMGQLIQDLLNLSRVSLEEMNREKVSLSRIAEHVVSVLQERSTERNIEIIIQSDMNVYADEGLMRILIENLMENSWKYSSLNDSAKIEFSCKQEANERVFFVKDNGVGFDVKYANRLFDPFHRLHSQAEFSGSGIGLATVQTIVHRHHGRIWAESKLNEGATFYFTLPI